jgi:radical SAM-linked protein
VPRIRVVFEKKGLMTFINHVDLPVLFSRAARRAGLAAEYTQGFSPRPRISLGPPLAIGVIGLDEPADFWFESWSDGCLGLWNGKLPDGIRLLRCAEVEGRALSKCADAALYRISGLSDRAEKASAVLDAEAERTGVLHSKTTLNESGELELIIGDLGHCGAGNLVRALTAEGVISGWSDILLTRVRVGRWDVKLGQILPLV